MASLNSTVALRERLIQMEAETDAEIAHLRARIVELEVSRKKTQIAREVLEKMDLDLGPSSTPAGKNLLRRVMIVAPEQDHPTIDRALTGVVVRQLEKGRFMTKEQLLQSFVAQKFLVAEADLNKALRRLLADQVVAEEGGTFFITPKSERPDAPTPDLSGATKKSVQDDLPQA